MSAGALTTSPAGIQYLLHLKNSRRVLTFYVTPLNLTTRGLTDSRALLQLPM